MDISANLNQMKPAAIARLHKAVVDCASASTINDEYTDAHQLQLIARTIKAAGEASCGDRFGQYLSEAKMPVFATQEMYDALDTAVSEEGVGIMEISKWLAAKYPELTGRQASQVVIFWMRSGLN
jgi:hypothetical protein